MRDEPVRSARSGSVRSVSGLRRAWNVVVLVQPHQSAKSKEQTLRRAAAAARAVSRSRPRRSKGHGPWAMHGSTLRTADPAPSSTDRSENESLPTRCVCGIAGCVSCYNLKRPHPPETTRRPETSCSSQAQASLSDSATAKPSKINIKNKNTTSLTREKFCANLFISQFPLSDVVVELFWPEMLLKRQIGVSRLELHLAQSTFF